MTSRTPSLIVLAIVASGCVSAEQGSSADEHVAPESLPRVVLDGAGGITRRPQEVDFEGTFRFPEGSEFEVAIDLAAKAPGRYITSTVRRVRINETVFPPDSGLVEAWSEAVSQLASTSISNANCRVDENGRCAEFAITVFGSSVDPAIEEDDQKCWLKTSRDGRDYETGCRPILP